MTNETTQPEEDAAAGESAVECLVSCRHTTTQGRAGEKGSWCVECGEKVHEVEDRKCQDCNSFFRGALNYTGCRTHLMAVTPKMNVTYEIAHGTCWKGS